VLSAKTVRMWYRTHKWTSLICTVFLLMSCITGLPLIFGEEIDDFLDHHVSAAKAPNNAPLARIDDIVKESMHRYPNLKIQFVTWDEDEPRVFVDLAPSFDSKPALDKDLIFDAHTGKLLEESKFRSDFMTFVTELHIELFAGLTGELILGVMGLLFVVALVSGFLVYGPFMRKLKFGAFRADSGSRVKWFDLHNLLGIVTLCWALVVGLTGVMNTLATPLFGIWRAQELPRLLAPYQGKPMPATLTSVDEAVRVASAAVPHNRVTSVVFPNDVFSSPYHYLVWTKGSTTLSSRLFTPVLVDVETARATQPHGLPWYLRLLEVCRPLHFGDYGGLPLKILWALFDIVLIVVLISGIYLCISRRKSRVEEELDVLVESEREQIEVIPG
jgi:uncharacterized iron-regulated membrane protein